MAIHCRHGASVLDDEVLAGAVLIGKNAGARCGVAFQRCIETECSEARDFFFAILSAGYEAIGGRVVQPPYGACGSACR